MIQDLDDYLPTLQQMIKFQHDVTELTNVAPSFKANPFNEMNY